jgi:hypothetical protein
VKRVPLHLNAAFRTFSQGDLDINAYWRKLKGMADTLRDLGEPVNDRTLVLNLLRGLNTSTCWISWIALAWLTASRAPLWLISTQNYLLMVSLFQILQISTISLEPCSILPSHSPILHM